MYNSCNNLLIIKRMKHSPRLKSKTQHADQCQAVRKSSTDLDIIFHYSPPQSRRFVCEENKLGKINSSYISSTEKGLQFQGV